MSVSGILILSRNFALNELKATHDLMKSQLKCTLSLTNSLALTCKACILSSQWRYGIVWMFGNVALFQNDELSKPQSSHWKGILTHKSIDNDYFR